MLSFLIAELHDITVISCTATTRLRHCRLIDSNIHRKVKDEGRSGQGNRVKEVRDKAPKC
jgi:hypothetical protein